MGNDYVQVRLTAAGIDQAGGHPLAVNGRVSVTFLPGQATRVARYEWDMMLRHMHTVAGDPLVELVPSANPHDEAHRQEND